MLMDLSKRWTRWLGLQALEDSDHPQPGVARARPHWHVVWREPEVTWGSSKNLAGARLGREVVRLGHGAAASLSEENQGKRKENTPVTKSLGK